MRALYIEKGEISLREIPDPISGENEALIEVSSVGICNTDLELIKGYMEFSGVPGHEFVGRVIKGSSDWIGKRVVGEINLGCGKCGACRRGMSRHCTGRSVLGIFNRQGAFADLLSLPFENLHIVPDDLSDEEAVFVEPLAAALRIPEQMKITPGQNILLIGDGKLAQLIARVLHLLAVKLEVVGKHEDKLELLKSYSCKRHLLGEYEADGSYDLVIEASGSPEGLRIAREALRPMGTIVLKSTYHGNVDFNFSSGVVDEISIVGSRCGPFPPAIDLLARKLVNPGPLISDRFIFGDIEKAFERALEHDSLKVVVKMNE